MKTRLFLQKINTVKMAFMDWHAKTQGEKIA